MILESYADIKHIVKETKPNLVKNIERIYKDFKIINVIINILMILITLSNIGLLIFKPEVFNQISLQGTSRLLIVILMIIISFKILDVFILYKRLNKIQKELMLKSKQSLVNNRDVVIETYEASNKNSFPIKLSTNNLFTPIILIINIIIQFII